MRRSVDEKKSVSVNEPIECTMVHCENVRSQRIKKQKNTIKWH